jgi:homoserine O-succinyltransferase/O-acetyltransferase
MVLSNPEFIDKAQLKNNWQANARIMMANWIGLVYRLTHFDMSKKYMDSIDSHDPLVSIMEK